VSSQHFDAYSSYYDLLYADKDYAGESAHIVELLKAHHPSADSILELGCGTGVHAIHFANSGYRLHGMDLSQTMLDSAAERLKGHPDIAGQVSFSQGDMRDFKVDGKFDVALAMFDVVSYVNDNDGIRSALNTIKTHLNPESVFLFDCWYGPAVYTQQPHTRIRTLEDDRVKITRTAEPLFHPRRNVVDVNYTVFVEDKNSGAIQSFKESHPMRCFFDAELDELFAQCGFEKVFGQTWFEGTPPSDDTWSVLFGYKLIW